MTAASARRLEALAANCSRFLSGDGPRSVPGLLDQIPDDTAPDVYGHGGVVEKLEVEIARLLGKEAALFIPTGTMAQQATLRVHCDRRSCHTVAMHRFCHLRQHEEGALTRLHGLSDALAGVPWEPMAPLDAVSLASIKEPVGALLVELPQRDLGGHLPTWNELVAIVEWARERGAAVHLDGARLWEAAPYYATGAKKDLAAISALFDTVYVSFYKGLGAIAGCCVAGTREVIDELEVWRVRHGARPYMMWPYAASALSVVRERPRDMFAYYRRAQAIAREIRALDGPDVLPERVRSPMMHLRIRATRDEMDARVAEVAESTSVWTFTRPFVSEGHRLQRYEFQVGRATMELSLDEAVAIIARLNGQRPRRPRR